MPWTSRSCDVFIGVGARFRRSLRKRKPSTFDLRARGAGSPLSRSDELLLGAAILVVFRAATLAQQRLDALALVDRIVVAEAKLRHPADLQHARELAPELL